MTKKLVRGLLFAIILLSISFTAAYASEVARSFTVGTTIRSGTNSLGAIA